MKARKEIAESTRFDDVFDLRLGRWGRNSSRSRPLGSAAISAARDPLRGTTFLASPLASLSHIATSPFRDEFALLAAPFERCDLDRIALQT